MFSKCPVSVSAPDTGSGRPWHKLWWWPSSHHSPAHYTRYWHCRGLLLHWNIYPRPDSTKRNWIRSLDFDDIQYPSVINNAWVDGWVCDRNGKWMQIFFALSAASLAASPVTSGQVLTPATASHSSLRRSLLSCQLVTGQERRALESSPNRFDHNGNKVGFTGHELARQLGLVNISREIKDLGADLKNLDNKQRSPLIQDDGQSFRSNWLKASQWPDMLS